MPAKILDRLSFMRFLGLSINDTVPDSKTIGLFRDKLTDGGMIEKIFSQIDKQLDKDGIIIHKGKIVDASIAEVPYSATAGRRTQQLNRRYTRNPIAIEWKENKLRQKNTAKIILYTKTT